MLRYIYASQLDAYPLLRDTMFRDRAHQFKTRLNWDVKVDPNGFERDEYDGFNPLYAIWERKDGSHGGSMRFLPTIGPNMVHDHFSHLCDGVRIESPLIWECTRFCLAPGQGRKTAAALVLAAGEIMENFHLSHFVGVFDRRMTRIYRTYQVEPDIIGDNKKRGLENISVGLWEMNKAPWTGTLGRVGITRATSREWFENSFRLGLSARQKENSAVRANDGA